MSSDEHTHSPNVTSHDERDTALQPASRSAPPPLPPRPRKASIATGHVQRATPRLQDQEEVQWQVPIYGNDYADRSAEEFPARQETSNDLPASENKQRDFADSDSTLNMATGETNDPYKKYSLSSYEHPYDIQPPENAYSGPGVAPLNVHRKRSLMQRRVSFSEEKPNVYEYVPQEATDVDPRAERALKRRGIPSNILDLYAIDNDANKDPENQGKAKFSSARSDMRRHGSMSSIMSGGSEVLDPDDPRVTGIEAKCLEDPEDVEKNALRQMDYRTRRKHLTRIKIEFNVTSMINRQEFLIKLAKALMIFGAPSHRIEAQLIAAARILEVEAEFIHLPGVIICSFGDQDLGCSETHFVKCTGRLSLGALHKVHLIYRNVVHDEISAKRATNDLEALLTAPPLYSMLFPLICPLAFGGSFVDMWLAGMGAFILSLLQLGVATKSVLYANVFE
ncbi:hypothetical protein C0993_000063 [Termitomyces sp. T159_Od127]|nr:hypothetical protein C0993_000063 [Termitomyces sp. T159_Od127]